MRLLITLLVVKFHPASAGNAYPAPPKKLRREWRGRLQGNLFALFKTLFWERALESSLLIPAPTLCIFSVLEKLNLAVVKLIKCWHETVPFLFSWFTTIQPLALKLEYVLTKSVIWGDLLNSSRKAPSIAAVLAVGITLGAAGAYFGRVAVFWCLALFALWVASEGRKAEGSLCLLCTRPERLLIHGTCPRKTIATWEMAASHGWPFRSREILKEKCCCAQLVLCTCCYQKLPLWIPFPQSRSQILLQSVTRGASRWLLQETCLRVAWNGSQTANPFSSLLVSTVA